MHLQVEMLALEQHPSHDPARSPDHCDPRSATATSGLEILVVALPPGRCFDRLVDRLCKECPAELARFPGDVPGTTLAVRAALSIQQ